MSIIDTIKFWINNARPYSVPMTFLSWLVIFCYGVKHGGNILCGLIALIGISLVHLSTNLCDDYFDYQRLSLRQRLFKFFKGNKMPIFA